MSESINNVAPNMTPQYGHDKLAVCFIQTFKYNTLITIPLFVFTVALNIAMITLTLQYALQMERTKKYLIISSSASIGVCSITCVGLTAAESKSRQILFGVITGIFGISVCTSQFALTANKDVKILPWHL